VRNDRQIVVASDGQRLGDETPTDAVTSHLLGHPRVEDDELPVLLLVYELGYETVVLDGEPPGCGIVSDLEVVHRPPSLHGSAEEDQRGWI